MGKQPRAVEVYLQQTRTHFFGLLAVAPLLVVYEAANDYLNRPAQGDVASRIEIRNSAELLIKRVLWFAHAQSNLMLWIVFGLVLLWAFWLAQKQGRLSFKPVYFPYQVFESLVYALVFGFAVSKIKAMLTLQASSGEHGLLTQRMILAMGAGIYEELLFRFLLVSAFAFIFHKLLRPHPVFGYAVAVLAAAVVFSMYHYWNHADVWSTDSFLFRLYAGCILGALYVLRGIGVAVYTHAFYDLFLLFRG